MKKIFFLISVFCIILLANISHIQAQTKGYEKMGKSKLKQLDGHWSAPANVKLLGNGKEILLKKMHFSIDEFSFAASMDFREIIDNKLSDKDQSEQVYNVALVNDVLVLMLNKDDKDSAYTPYIFVIKKIDAQSMILATEKEDLIFKKTKD